MNQPIKCPICSTNDFVEYVFYAHHDPKIVGLSHFNPTDNHTLFRCRNGHVFDTFGELTVVERGVDLASMEDYDPNKPLST